MKPWVALCVVAVTACCLPFCAHAIEDETCLLQQKMVVRNHGERFIKARSKQLAVDQWAHVTVPDDNPMGWSGSPGELAPCPDECTAEQCGTPDLADMDKPILRVLAEKPDVYGFCYFQTLGFFWFSGVPGIMMSHSYIETIQKDVQMDWATPLNVPVETFTYADPSADSGNVSIRSKPMAQYVGSFYDIPYCYALGWLRGQPRLAGTDPSNFTAWEELSKAECRNLKELEDFDDDAETISMHILTDTAYPSLRSIREHVYGKCLLGSAGAEMLWCHLAIGCVKGQDQGLDYVGHGAECL
mmetsp:Transcript_43801/g.77528  ORF Transcript_43801/g.77528 Transcript_43801/m.77528 type:complete len:300 (+) Transcript_43801:71-970(+)